MNRLADLLGVRPDVLEVDLLAVVVRTDRILLEVDVHPPGEAISDDQRRGREVVRLDLRVDTRLEVAIAERTLVVQRSCSSIAFSIGSASGPELPIQVVQP